MKVKLRQLEGQQQQEARKAEKRSEEIVILCFDGSFLKGKSHFSCKFKYLGHSSLIYNFLCFSLNSAKLK